MSHLLSPPYPVWHVDGLASVSINVPHESKLALEALHCEQSVHERVNETLVKVVVDATTIDALREEGPQCTPGDLVRGEVGTTLGEGMM